MIKRIVKMIFVPEKVDDFMEVFNASKAKIRSFDGCSHLELWNDVRQSNVFFTYSIWKSPGHLEQYRQSELFRQTWSKTKPLFLQKPEAWSVDSVVVDGGG